MVSCWSQTSSDVPIEHAFKQKFHTAFRHGSDCSNHLLRKVWNTSEVHKPYQSLVLLMYSPFPFYILKLTAWRPQRNLRLPPGGDLEVAHSPVGVSDLDLKRLRLGVTRPLLQEAASSAVMGTWSERGGASLWPWSVFLMLWCQRLADSRRVPISCTPGTVN